MSSIGSILKEARNKKSVTLEEVYAKTKIHPRVLQLLEDEKFDKLPSPLFVKSFLKSYAEFLEVNPEELIRTYEKEDRKEPEQLLYLKPAGYQKPLFLLDGGLSKILAASLVVILFSTSAIFLFKAIKNGWTGKGKKSAVSAKTSVKVTSKTASQDLKKLGEDWLYHSSLRNFPTLKENTPLKLNIRAHNDVWLRITCDEKVLFESILKKGAAESWTADKTIEVWTGNASSMRLAVNGTVLKSSPRKAVIKKMLVNHEGVKVMK